MGLKMFAAATVAAFLAFAPIASATAPDAASCQGAVTSDQATSGVYQNAFLASQVLALGGTNWAALQTAFAQQQPCG